MSPRSDLDQTAEFLESEPPHWVARVLAWIVIGVVVLATIAGILIEVPTPSTAASS